MRLDGIWFYWFAWMGWIIITFHLQKGKLRSRLAIAVLVLISSAHINFLVYKMYVSVGFVFLLFLLYFEAARLKNMKLLYILICTFILTFAYVSFQLFRIFDPVWIIFHPVLMVTFILTYLVLILVKGMKERLLTFLFGICHGEILNSVIMQYFKFPYNLGDLLFFDVVAIGLVLISLWFGIERFSSSINLSLIKTNKRKAGTL